MGDVRSVLLRTKELIDRGWCQDHFEIEVGGKTCLCLASALSQAAKDLDASPVFQDAVDKICDRLNHFPSLACLLDFNDTPGRTKEEVIALLESVLKQDEEQD